MKFWPGETVAGLIDMVAVAGGGVSTVTVIGGELTFPGLQMTVKT